MIRSSTARCSRWSTFMMRTEVLLPRAGAIETTNSDSGDGEFVGVVADVVGHRAGRPAGEPFHVIGDELRRAGPEQGEHVGEVFRFPVRGAPGPGRLGHGGGGRVDDG